LGGHAADATGKVAETDIYVRQKGPESVLPVLAGLLLLLLVMLVKNLSLLPGLLLGGYSPQFVQVVAEAELALVLLLLLLLLLLLVQLVQLARKVVKGRRGAVEAMMQTRLLLLLLLGAEPGRRRL
jgi:hypothetical protein